MSFTDSFLDFEAIKNWFESIPNPNMSDSEKAVTVVLEPDSCRETGVQELLVDGSEPISDESGPVARVEDKGIEMVENVGCSIEDDLGKVSLVGESGKSIDISESVVNSEAMDGSDEKREAVSGEAGDLIDIGESGSKKSGIINENDENRETVNSNGIGENGTHIETTDQNDENGETVNSNGIGENGAHIETTDQNDEKRETVDGETGANSGIIDGNGEKSKAVSKEDESESSESESESASSSSSSSRCSSSDVEVVEAEEKEEKAGEVEEGEIRDVDFQDVLDDGTGKDEVEDVEAMVDWSDVDDEDDGIKGPIRSKNEAKFLPPVPPVDASLQPHHQTLPVGVVLSIVGTQVVVEGIEEHSPLSDGSILWMTESRSPLGLVDEIFGPVKNPYYIVRYNSESEVPDGISIGTSVCFVPEFASHVLSNNKDIYKKGYDASGANDEEISDEAEFSDDEKEAEHKKMLKASKRGTVTTDTKPRKNKNNKKSFESRGEPWKSNKPSPSPHQPRPHFSPLPTSAGLAPTLQPVWPNAPPNGVWPNGAPFQQPQGSFFPNGFPTNNNMMWAPQNPQQFPAYPMNMPNGMMPFNQQVNPNQSMPPGQLNTLAGIPFGQGFVGQNSFNPMPFGIGFQGQPSPSTLNVVGQGINSNGLSMGQNFSAPQSGGVPGNNEAPQQFNPGPRGRGSGPYRRGGGRFSRGRGRKQ